MTPIPSNITKLKPIGLASIVCSGLVKIIIIIIPSLIGVFPLRNIYIYGVFFTLVRVIFKKNKNILPSTKLDRAIL